MVSPNRIPPGLKQSWQAAWDLWKGLDVAQTWLLEFCTQLVGTWAGMSGLLRRALQLPPVRATWEGVSPVGLGWEPTYIVIVWGHKAVEREGRASGEKYWAVCTYVRCGAVWVAAGRATVIAALI